MRRKKKDRAGALPLALLLILLAAAASSAPAFAEEGGGTSPPLTPAPGVYSISCDLPADLVTNVTVTAAVPAGLVYRPESLSVTGAADLSSAGAAVTTDGGADGTANFSISIFLPEVNNTLDLDLLVEFVAVVADIPENADGTVLAPVEAFLSFADASGRVREFSGSIPGVWVVEPDLAASKRIVGAYSSSSDPGSSGSDPGSGEGVLYEVAVFHTSASTSTGYDLLVADLVPEGAAVITETVEIVSGPAGSFAIGADGAGAGAGPVFSFDALDLSWTASSPALVRYAANTSSSSSSSSGSGEAGGRLDWTSAAGEVPEERSYTFEYGLDPYSDLNLTLEANSAGVVVGATVTYVYTLRNSGFSNLTGLAVVDDVLGPITLDRDFLSPGGSAVGFADREVVSTDFPGPVVANASAAAVDEVGTEVTASASLALSFFENHLSIVKRADKKVADRGELVNYTITLTAGGQVSPTNLVVEDVFSRPVEIVSMTPPPDPDGKWRYDNLWELDNRTEILITIRVPDEQDFSFDSASSVAGSGFVNVRNDYSTTYQPFTLRNCASVTYTNGTLSDVRKLTSCATVAVRAGPGTGLTTKEHGSGSYSSGETVSVRTENRSISMEKDLSASAAGTTLELYHGRTVTYASSWSSSAVGKNRVTGASMTESYRRASHIDRESRFFLDRNESVMEFDSSFDGEATIGFIRMPTNTSTFRATPLFEGREDYSGSFRVYQKVDEYGKAVKSEKEAAGTGFVSVDKRVGSSQRTYEYGSGSYDVDEIIETYTNYIAKDISVVASPAATPVAGSSLLWKEGIASKDPGKSYLGEEYSSVSRLDKETVARGLNEMETAATFSGTARYRIVHVGRSANATANATANSSSKGAADPAIDFDETYTGDYSIERRVLISGAAKYDRPHLNVSKALYNISTETVPWGYGEPHLPGETKKRKVAQYTIRIENDGNRALGPILVRDIFPPGATFIEPSSLRPTSVSGGGANWTLTHLAIGGVAKINLTLDVTATMTQELVNRAEVCGGFGGDQWICAANYTALEMGWLPCCTDEITVVKTAKVDSENPMVVHYRVDVENVADATRAATVTDHLPQGMRLLDSSLPFASYEDCVVVWILPEIGPRETATIEFSALAPGLGRFTNVVEVESRSVEGPLVKPLTVASVVQVGSDGECGPTGCGIWQPPGWDFTHFGGQPDILGCELLTCTATTGCLQA
jgi:uncharacterized repeat protein (TIGR01451 family)